MTLSSPADLKMHLTLFDNPQESGNNPNSLPPPSKCDALNEKGFNNLLYFDSIPSFCLRRIVYSFRLLKRFSILQQFFTFIVSLRIGGRRGISTAFYWPIPIYL